ncbi:MAG: glycosyltransferase family 4 protein [candidate division KSB1 bacterium]|nr:glycosyltransferase family 4 protein [candidate division KSB1 bacterium]MDZ7334021.1 glycosyltransferase family 4 protein [candidate division KSB1 bacterium]MDZ7357456.1 glycosyltransferase family 4 protein [candidate division KSB1 bacterium]MDZ7400006.1 glycosyltransferase family 4 protein [candidate division KSB1 bacterium]
MKVLMIAPQPFFQPRGTPISVLHRIHALSQLGHQIDLVTYHLGQTIPFENVTYYRIPKIPFIRKIKVGPSKAKILVDFFVILKTLSRLMKVNYDVIHSHEEAGFFGAWLARKFGIMHLYDMHSSLPQQLTNFKFTRLKFLIHLFERLERKTIERSDALITICPELYNYVAQLYPGKKQMLIENVADNSVVFGDEPGPELDLRQQYQLNSKTIILYAGTFEPYQGLDLLIDASQAVIAKDKNVKFALVGGNPKQVAHYQRMVTQRNLDDYFVFTGQVAPNLVPKFLEIADILVTPRIEGNNTPLKIYSYLRSGKPIVATNHITHTQVLNDQVALLTECTAEAFANGLIRVLKDEPLRKSLSENARLLAQEKYSYEVYLQKTRNLYYFLEQKKRLIKEIK